MAVSYIGGTRGFPPTPPAHVAGDLILLCMRNTDSTIPTKPAAGGTVPNWTVIEAVAGANFAWALAWTIATASDTTVGTWPGYAVTQGCMCLVFRAAAGKIPAVASFTPRADETPTSTIVWPAMTASKTDGTSLGVLCAQTGNYAGYTNNGTFRPTGFGSPKITDSASTNFESAAMHVSTANLTANIASFTSGSAAPSTWRQRTVALEIVEASPVVSAGPRMML